MIAIGIDSGTQSTKSIAVELGAKGITATGARRGEQHAGDDHRAIGGLHEAVKSNGGAASLASQGTR